MNVEEIALKWDELKKALSHANAISSATVPTPKEPEEFPTPSSEHLEKAKYGVENIPGSDVFGTGASTLGDSIGSTKIGNKEAVIRHGAAAHRVAVEHEMSKLVGADHMLANQSYDPGMHHPAHHNQATFDVDNHGGTSIQEHVGGRPIHLAQEDKHGLDDLRNQWKNGDLHKLWALHYISNNIDMHPGNFSITKGGAKAFDSDHAFYELPLSHLVIKGEGGAKPKIEYVPYATNYLPAYLSPFMENEDDGVELKYPNSQVSSKVINDHASKIDPELFSKFGKHAYERAVKAKKALSSADPTKAMMELWHSHHDKTYGVKNG